MCRTEAEVQNGLHGIDGTFLISSALHISLLSFFYEMAEIRYRGNLNPLDYTEPQI